MSIKQLKPGDEIFIRAKYERTLDDGDVRFSCSVTDERDKVTTDVGYAHPSSVILPPPAPKYDPCRPFKQGDRVKPRIVYGRKPVCGIDGVAVQINSVDLIVESNEGKRKNGTVDIKFPCGTIGAIDPVYLELVTPVEEMEPYHINEIFDIDDGKLIGYEVAHGDTRESIFNGGETHLRSIEKAKAAAEAERDRLNAEYRKEQK